MDDDNIDVGNDNDKDSGEKPLHTVATVSICSGNSVEARRALNEACKMQSSSFTPSKKERLLDN